MPKYLLPYLRFIRDNKTVFLTMCRHNAVFRLEELFHGLSAHVLLPIMDRFGCKKEEQPFFLQFYIRGTIAVILTWLERNCTEPDTEIASIIMRCVLQK